eukprot:Em0010g910a
MNKLQNPEVIEWRDLDKKKYYVFGPVVAVLVRGVVYPFNLIKTRLFVQAQKSMYSGTFQALSVIVKNEGAKGLYKGFHVNLLGLVSGQVYITTYELVRNQLVGYSSELKGLIAGGVGTMVAQTVTVPVDVVSQHLMMQGQTTLRGRASSEYVLVKNADYVLPRQKLLQSAWEVTKKLVSTEGFLGLYKGYTVSLLTYAPNSALWWGFYSGLYRRSMERRMADRYPLAVIQAACGVCAGVMAAILTNPMDVVRARYQLQQGGTIKDTVRKLYKEEGVAALKKGLSARMVSSIIVSALMITSYEWVKRLSLRSAYL